MIRRASTISAFFLALLTLFSCEKDLEISVPTSPPQLVVNSVFSQDSLWRIEVSTSASPGQNLSIRSLKHPEIQLTEDGNLIKDLVVDSSFASPGFFGDRVTDVSIYFQRTMTSRPQPGHSYSIEVSYPGFRTVSAVASVPMPVLINRKTNLQSQSLIVVEGKQMRRFQFSILDSPDSRYYGIEVFKTENDGTNPQRIQFYSADQVFAENIQFDEDARVTQDGRFYDPSRAVFFSDETFSGKERNFSIYLDADLDPSTPIYVRALTLSDELYHFVVAYQRQQQNSGNPFAEPTQVYTNILNGYGIFAGYSVSETALN